MNIIYLSKNNGVGQTGLETVSRHFPAAILRSHFFGSTKESLPSWIGTANDLLISFLCPRVIPVAVLRNSVLPINFHPAPPEYPGFGCYNFAIYDAAPTYGVTCHRMSAVIDSGEIYAVRRFPVQPGSTVVSLQQRSLQELCGLLDEVTARIAAGQALPVVDRWRRPPTTRKDFEALREIPLDASEGEVVRRVGAFAHPNFDGAYIRFHGVDFMARYPGERTN